MTAPVPYFHQRDEPFIGLLMRLVVVASAVV